MIGLGLEKSRTGLGLTLWYIGVRLEKVLRLPRIWTDFMIYWIWAWKTLGLLDSDWFYNNQVGMLLEKFENLLELSVRQLVIQSRLISSISLGQTMFHVWKTKC